MEKSHKLALILVVDKKRPGRTISFQHSLLGRSSENPRESPQTSSASEVLGQSETMNILRFTIATKPFPTACINLWKIRKREVLLYLLFSLLDTMPMIQ